MKQEEIQSKHFIDFRWRQKAVSQPSPFHS